MRVSFTKMHGLGNDFIVLDAREAELPPVDACFARQIADRRTGVGCDQLILLNHSDCADFRMRIFNSDGSEVESCGNASRAVALLHGKPACIETGGGLISAHLSGQDVAVDMGEPQFEWDAIPLAFAMDTLSMPVGWEYLENPVAVNVGNPHAVFFVDNCDAVDLARLGPLIETDPVFPNRVNVNVATVESRAAIRLHVWERGAGLTRACGTGACATAIAAMRRGLVDRTANITLPGGTLTIEWGEDNRITMTGPATIAFTGSFDWDQFA
ncbi:diaminopimelate epimerase [Altericroceibacterium spongiae]|uniref:Diaminopimelate epimerase n=1 Tax=Altericroceibacterium spongiae TaxID=2320269 RepID=A0A420EMN8_9SPHN|nr:diaminopimelate epimerase [Altericroceibacterium spongiae]RKF21995.1 diaminopimelate epimerase [Altericroceibacterium spongiae]